MDYQAIYDYSKDIADNIGISVKWVHADLEWLSMIKPDQGLTCWSLPFESSFNFDPHFNRTFTLAFIFYQQDFPDSDMDQNDTSKQQESIRTLAITDQAAQKFARLFDSNDLTDDLDYASQKITITGAATDPAIRDTEQLLTGTKLTLTVQVPDDFDYCSLDNAT